MKILKHARMFFNQLQHPTNNYLTSPPHPIPPQQKKKLEIFRNSSFVYPTLIPFAFRLNQSWLRFRSIWPPWSGPGERVPKCKDFGIPLGFLLHPFLVWSLTTFRVWRAFCVDWPWQGQILQKRDGPLRKLARGDGQTHFETFNFWIKPWFLWFRF